MSAAKWFLVSLEAELQWKDLIVRHPDADKWLTRSTMAKALDMMTLPESEVGKPGEINVGYLIEAAYWLAKALENAEWRPTRR